MVDDGYIKYNCFLTKAQPLPKQKIDDLNIWRQKLYDLNLIGAYPNHVGFGNISIRISGTDEFIVSGTATGNMRKLNQSHYTVVTKVDIDMNSLYCVGPCKASSESMTHAAIYRGDPTINAVIHVHNLAMWESFYDAVPTSDLSATYGTPKMAHELQKIASNMATQKRKQIVVMGGHKEGIIVFGKTLDEAGELLLKYLKKINGEVRHLDVHDDE